MKIRFLLLTTTLLTLNSFAQEQHLVDSLTTQLKNHNARKLELRIKSQSLFDSTASNILNALSIAYLKNDQDKSMKYANESLALSEQIGFKKGVANACKSIGSIKSLNGDNITALLMYNKSLKILTEISDKQGIARLKNKIGTIYINQGNYPEALKNFFFALKRFEEIGDKNGIAVSYKSIGLIYNEQGNFPEALKNYSTSLKIFKEIGDKNGISKCYMQIGYLYENQNNYSESLKNYLTYLKIVEELGDKQGIAGSYLQIGSIYTKQGNYTEALKMEFAALKIFEETGRELDIASAYGNIAQTFIKQKKYSDASQYLDKGLSIAKENNSLRNMVLFYRDLATLDSTQGNYKQELTHYKLYINTRDSLVNKENTKKITQQQMQHDFDNKESLAKADQEKKDALAQKEMQKQKLVRDGFIVGAILFLLLAGVIFMGLRKTAIAKKRSEELLLNILPAEVAEELKLTGTAKAKSFTMVTVMFTDFKDFTTVSEKVSAELLVEEIHTCFSAFDIIIQKHKIEKIKTIGDAYLCASGLPVSNYTHAVDMLNAAFEIRSYMLQRKKEKEARGEIPFELRVGIHTGPVVAGIVGVKKYAYDIWGDTVNIASRMESSGDAGKVNISGSTYELVKEKFSCTHRGKVQAKNKGEIDMYFVEEIS